MTAHTSQRDIPDQWSTNTTIIAAALAALKGQVSDESALDGAPAPLETVDLAVPAEQPSVSAEVSPAPVEVAPTAEPVEPSLTLAEVSPTSAEISISPEPVEPSPTPAPAERIVLGPALAPPAPVVLLEDLHEAAPADAPEPAEDGAEPEPAADLVPASDLVPEAPPAVRHPVAARPSLAEAEAPPLTRRARREAQGLTAPRVGLFARLLTVRSFRAHEGRKGKLDTPEAVVRALLDEAAVHGVHTLHGRRVPGHRSAVEHVAVGPSGVFVVDVNDAKNLSVELRRSPDGGKDLVVGGRVATSAPSATSRRVAALRAVLDGADLANVPVTGVLCLVDGLLPLGVSALQVEGTHVVRQTSLTALVSRAGFLDEEHRATLRDFLRERLTASG
jgi:hypothetical protein